VLAAAEVCAALSCFLTRDGPRPLAKSRLASSRASQASRIRTDHLLSTGGEKNRLQTFESLRKCRALPICERAVPEASRREWGGNVWGDGIVPLFVGNRAHRQKVYRTRGRCQSRLSECRRPVRSHSNSPIEFERKVGSLNLVSTKVAVAQRALSHLQG
jgi:hypothetical protein